MKTIKFVDIRDYDTDTSRIAGHLTEALKRIRKNKLAADLIGDDEKSEGQRSNDPDGFADELSAGVELTYRDKSRILERARRLAERSATASGTSHLKKEEVARLAPVVAGIQLVMGGRSRCSHSRRHAVDGQGIGIRVAWPSSCRATT